MDAKPWWLSRTIIIGIVVALVGAAGTIANLISGGEVLNAETQATIATAIAGALMLVLRWVTKQPIA